MQPGRLLGRLIAPDIFTRRYMPFHISDILSFGALPDLALQWGRFGGLWMKHPKFRNGAELKLRDACVSQGDWERLYFAEDAGGHLDLLGSLPHGVMLQSALDISKYG